MDHSFPEIFGIYQLTKTENGLCFSLQFRLDKPINSCNLVINDEVRLTFLQYHGEVENYNSYLVFTYLLQNEYIKNAMLSIKNSDGLEVGWKIYENIDDVSYESAAQSSPLLETLTFPATSPNANTLVCMNCGVKETPLWRIRGMERYCNACCLYWKRNGIRRRLNGDKVLRKERKRKLRSCVECNTNSSPIWRNVDNKTYCNKHGLAKRKRLSIRIR